MEHPGFFDRAGPFSLAEVAQATGATFGPGADPAHRLSDVRALADAGRDHVSFLDNRKYLGQLQGTRAGACLISPALADRVPATTAALLLKAPYRGFAMALQLFYPGALQPRVAVGGQSFVDPSARLEEGVTVETGAVIGPEARIGTGTRIAAGAVIGYRCMVGRNCFIGPQATITHSLIGNGVIIHAGARLGQDGFGFAMGPQGHLKVPQIGRVIIQDNVEIGANTAIDRGALKDTVVGEGTKIDNLVQIGHNVVIGRHCVIVAQSGVAGSAELGDFVVMGGQSGVVGHIKIGTGAQIAGASHPTGDVPMGARMGGTPARPLKDWGRELATLKKLAGRDKGRGEPDES